MNSLKNTYRTGQLPHLQPKRATYSVIILVDDAVPKPILYKLANDRNEKLSGILRFKKADWRNAYFKARSSFDRRLDILLQQHANQTHPLADARAAQVIVDTLKKYDGVYYDLYSYSVMSNHVHIEIDLSVQTDDLNYVPLSKVMNLIKGGSSFRINRILGRRGKPLWARRYRDRFIRGETHLYSAYRYTLNNPVAAGITQQIGDHPFTGGKSWEEISALAERRVYPSPQYWYDRLMAYDLGEVG
ncbi:transposase [Lewinella sp. 4G2]|uniref:transposase n=1 Tax=Lewinella sp. 4G2 TaxID=1803372 RepID=UPI0007B4774D|nr:transposase [Lewinella sp. 4G2]OAV46268.1 hypothetical protein A3850_018605 [Lewinella sp. 4G2]